VILFIFKLNLGIDITSGTIVDFESKNKISDAKVTKKLEYQDFKPTQVSLSYYCINATVQFKINLSKFELYNFKNNIYQSFVYYVTVNTVSPVIGQELAKNAMMALLYAAIGIIIYITFRFEWRMGLSSVLALLHDAFMIVAVFSLFRLEVDITFIAAVLTIIGYSINDTIVTFDRVRENLHKIKVITKPEQIDDIVNRS